MDRSTGNWCNSPVGGSRDGGLSRRAFIARTAATGVTATTLGGLWRTVPALAAECARPAGFPDGIPLETRTFENWARETIVADLPFAVPRSTRDVVAVVNWAATAGWRVRACGFMHGWAPLVVTPGTTCDSRVLLVDLTRHLTSVDVLDGGDIVAAGGASLEAVTLVAQQHGRGFTNLPAPGNLTIGGALAVGAHGTSVPAIGERGRPRHAYGSLSNRVLELTALVWDQRRHRYVARRFTRRDRPIDALLAHLGRSLVTSVRLRTEPDHNLRCESITDVSATEMFAAPGTPGRTFASYVDASGRAEAIWFPYTERPWLKIWSVSPEKPASSRAVTEPYNYPFSDNVPVEISTLAERVVEGDESFAPVLGRAMASVADAGLDGMQCRDLWGPSRALLLYIKPSTLRYAEFGYAIHCCRGDLQRVVHGFVSDYQRLLDGYAAQGRHPVNGPVEIRVQAPDHPDVGVPGARAPRLTATRPRPDRPAWDTVVWLNLLSFPGNPGLEFYNRLEPLLLERFDGTWAGLRVEWSKGWAYTPQGPWTNDDVIGRTVPRSLSTGYPRSSDFAATMRELRALDPQRVFGNAFLDRLTKVRRRR